MTLLFSEGVAEILAELPRRTQLRAAQSFELMLDFPRMYPVRRRGLMHGYHYFLAGRFLFYYSISGDEIRVTAIIPGAMRQA